MSVFSSGTILGCLIRIGLRTHPMPNAKPTIFEFDRRVFGLEWISWDVIRAHMCTFSVSLGLHATWRSPRLAFQHGGLQYGLALTAAMLGVALPLALLQLAIGQLSQQDAVGVWGAVPFFKGVGYLRWLVSFLGAIYSVIYVSVSFTYLLYTISNTLPFWECVDMSPVEDGFVTSLNASACLNETFMAPVSAKPEYFLAVALIVLVLWIILPFIFYNPVKLMKRILYVLGPIVFTLIVVVMCYLGDSMNLSSFVKRGDWTSFVEPKIWHGALVQALLSSQVAGGYLISSGDALYSNTNVEWTAIIFVGMNVVTSWIALLFWYLISNTEKETSVFAVLIMAYKVGEDPSTHVAWPIVIFLTLLLSGFISLLSLLFPIYDRFLRMGGLRWRLVSVAGSVVAAAVTLGVLTAREPAIAMLDDYAVPLLVSLATVVEILAFIFIYGWKVLVEDVDLLTDNQLCKLWTLGWCVAPGVLAPFTVWWVITVVRRDQDWLQPPWPAVTIIATMSLAVLIIIVVASVTIAKQVHYDLIGKLKSSFRPSRHWGPRDPITHYYWMARREELAKGNKLSRRYQRRQLGQLSGLSGIRQFSGLSARPNYLTLKNSISEKVGEDTEKKRSKSDDWMYTEYRKQVQRIGKYDTERRRRAKSLDWTFPKFRPRDTVDLGPTTSKESNRRIVFEDRM